MPLPPSVSYGVMILTVRSKWFIAAALAVTGAMGAGCSSSTESPGLAMEPETAAEIPAGARQVTFEPIDEISSPMSMIIDQRRIVIRDAGDWSEFWDEFVRLVEPQPDPSSVDFSTQMVIAATMGQRTSGGYTISVEEVAEKDGTLFAAVQEVTPGVLCITTDVMTAPAVAVMVPRHVGTVAFVDTELALPCAP